MAEPAFNRGLILVTGASGGVGQMLVSQLVERGYSVLGSVLNEAERVEANALGLSSASFFIADFGNSEVGLTQIKAALTASDLPLQAVIGCAGINPCGPIETTPIAVFRRAVEINVAGNIALYQATLPEIRNNAGRYIFVSSVSGRVAMPLLGYYTASKHALEGLVDTMRLEAGQWGIPISLVEPGAISTNMTRGFGEQLNARLSELNEEGRENYGAYFAQQIAFAKAADATALSADEVAASVIGILESEQPEARYPLGGAIDLIAQRGRSSDTDMDAFMNSLLPGQRAPA